MTFKHLLASVVFIHCFTCSAPQSISKEDKCLSSSGFFNESASRCQCHRGFNGLGDLCCAFTSVTNHCYIGGDPWLSAYDSSQAPVNFPCVSRFSVINGRTRGGISCVVETMNTGHFVSNGAMYTDRTVVSVKIGSETKKWIKIVKNTIQRPDDSEFLTFAELNSRGLTSFNLFGESFKIFYDSLRLIWTIRGCDTDITFRAATDQKAIQDRTPGVCVTALKRSPPSGNTGDGDICSITSSDPASPGVLQHNILLSMIKDYTKLDPEAKNVQPEYQSNCQALENIVATDCTDDNTLSRSVKQCAPILYHSLIRYCFDLTGIRGSNLLELFNACLTYNCKQTTAECKTFMASSLPVSTCLPTFCEMANDQDQYI